MKIIRPGLLHTHKSYLLCIFLISLKCYEVKVTWEREEKEKITSMLETLSTLTLDLMY